MLYEANGEAGALGRAIDELEIALDLDGQRDPEEIRRFSAKKVAQIEEQLERLRQLRNGPPGE